MAALTLDQIYPETGTRKNNGLTSSALSLYNRSLAQARLSQIWSSLTRRPARLADLEGAQAEGKVQASHYKGIHSVPIRQIRGSLGRSEDFDNHFRPLQERTRDRWVSVAKAMQSGQVLPPVELIQIGEDYFVRDGHHRISAAQALGQCDIDAEVTVVVLN